MSKRTQIGMCSYNKAWVSTLHTHVQIHILIQPQLIQINLKYKESGRTGISCYLFDCFASKFGKGIYTNTIKCR